MDSWRIDRSEVSALIKYIQTLPEGRIVLLRKEPELLHRSAERLFTKPENRALAEVSDFQRVGSNHGRCQADRQVKEAVLP